jgi:hypothetical protein
MSENNTVETRHHHSNGAPIWGIFFLLLGIVLLLQTLNVLPWGLWGTLWRFWPAIIIVIGLALILRHTSIWLVSLLTLVILGGSIGIAVWQYNTSGAFSNSTTETVSRPVGNLQHADVNIDFAAGRLTAGSLSGTSANLYEAKVVAKNNISSIDDNLNQNNSDGQITINSINQQYWPSGITWNLDFTDKIPLTFDINASGSSTNLDFTGIKVSGFNLELNAGSSNVKLPLPKGIVQGSITANAASMEITLPAGAAARIQATTSVATFDIDKRFTKQGNIYVTSNYDNATDRYDLSINTSVGMVEVK